MRVCLSNQDQIASAADPTPHIPGHWLLHPLVILRVKLLWPSPPHSPTDSRTPASLTKGSRIPARIHRMMLPYQKSHHRGQNHTTSAMALGPCHPGHGLQNPIVSHMPVIPQTTPATRMGTMSTSKTDCTMTPGVSNIVGQSVRRPHPRTRN